MKYSTEFSLGQAKQKLPSKSSTSQAMKANDVPEVWQVGQLVTLCEPIATNPTGCVGLVYQLDMDDPQTPYVAIILETGDDLNLIQAAHVHDSFVALVREPFTYEFISPTTLMTDFKRGLFTELFAKGHRFTCGDGNG